jgi:hypothetical protein
MMGIEESKDDDHDSDAVVDEGELGVVNTTLRRSPPRVSNYGQCGRVVRPTLKVAEVGGSCPCETQLLE